ncbi:MAG: biotin carboxylase, partial [Bacteroidota bacterium]
FLMDADLNFYFLEMNTRLQVEHPVTELITGVDLVEQQIKVARGEVLSLKQEDLEINGHAVELRVYAEDPLNNFLPSVGTLERYDTPSGPFIRLDDAYETGMDIPIYYDPMIAKLVTYGKNRDEAIQNMKEAIRQYKIEGVETTLPFGAYVCDHISFTSGNFDTHFVKDYYNPEAIKEEEKEKREIASIMALKAYLDAQKELTVANGGKSNWRANRL